MSITKGDSWGPLGRSNMWLEFLTLNYIWRARGGREFLSCWFGWWWRERRSRVLQASELPVLHLCKNIILLTTENHPISNHMDAYPCNLVGITTYLLSLPSPCETNLGSTNSGRGPINQLEQQTQFYYIHGICALYKYAPQNKQKQKTK